MNTDFNYSSVASLIQAAEKNNLPVSALVLSQQAQQIELDEKTVYEKMASNFQVMKECIEPGCDEQKVPVDLQEAMPLSCAGTVKAAKALPVPSFPVLSTGHWLSLN